MKRLKILYVNKNELRGGAARTAASLRALMQSRGHSAFFAVARKESADEAVLEIPFLSPLQNPVSKKLWQTYQYMLKKDHDGFGLCLRRLLLALANPPGMAKRFLGIEDFNFPGSRQILELPPEKPDLVHLHNLHANYFDLKYLPELSRRTPTFITLHDEWLLTGHCAGTFGCERWKNGCGHCPDLNSYPAVNRDATRSNWRRKQQIFTDSRLYIASPSAWLMEKARHSMLAQAVVESRIIPNGVDQKIFIPGDKARARRELGLATDAKMVLVQAAPNYSGNRFKDYETIRRCVSIILESTPDDIKIAAVGPLEGESEFQSAKVRIFPYQKEQEGLARLYQAADVFLHAAYSDNFPTVILESLSCGTPVVATSVGGIPEQIRSGENGFLVGKQDAEDMADITMRILNDSDLLTKLSNNAKKSACPFYSLERMADEYEAWYLEVIDRIRTDNHER